VLNNAVKAYQSVHKETMTGRETEARVLMQAALKLVECQKNWDSTDRRQRLDEALRYNQRVWSIFQVEAAKEDNPLPTDIKRNIILLSRFIDSRIFETMAFPSPDKLNAIISINKNLAAGLRGSSSGPIS
jgi:flagellar biosynthesis activator protein FlaF